MPRLTKPPSPKKLATSHKRKAPTPIKVHAGSNITKSEYSPETGQLTVTFAQGSTYQYDGVKPATAKGFTDAASQGSFLHTHVIGKHKATKI